MCVPCFNKYGHDHKMDKLGLGFDEDGDSGERQQSPQDARKRSIQRCINSLLHACQCRDINCRMPSCNKMKRIVTHTKSCKRKTNGGCPICKQLIALCCYHAKYCQENKCPVPFCPSIKVRLKQQQLQQRLQSAKLLQRRMALMTGARGGMTSSSSVSHIPQQQPQQTPLQTTNLHMNPGMNNAMGKPAQPPNSAAMQAAAQAQLMAKRQATPAFSQQQQPVQQMPQGAIMTQASGGKPVQQINQMQQQQPVRLGLPSMNSQWQNTPAPPQYQAAMQPQQQQPMPSPAVTGMGSLPSVMHPSNSMVQGQQRPPG